MELTKPAITIVSVEQSALNLWHEFLAGYFDGAAHLIRGNSVVFPDAQLLFQQAKQPTKPLSIHLVGVTQPRVIRRMLPNGRRTGQVDMIWNFWLRASGVNTGTGGPDVQIKKLEDALFMLLSDKLLTAPLARRGIHHVAPRLGAVSASAEYAMRTLTVSAVLRFPLEMAPMISGATADTSVQIGTPTLV
ncbi:MAG TPA: hypothetical protein VNU68_31270 [Verrucomicrobiae bacterium]|nr:hypothetical protein [Verrucomicrobiae bacterium]